MGRYLGAPDRVEGRKGMEIGNKGKGGLQG